MKISPNICIVITHKYHAPNQNRVNKMISDTLEFIAVSDFTVGHVVLLGSGGDNKNN